MPTSINYVFQLAETEIELADQFVKLHREKHKEEMKARKPGFGDFSPFSYIFREGCIGNSADIKCDYCNEIGNITDTKLW